MVLLWVLREKVPRFQTFLEVGCGTGYVLEGVNRSFPEVSLYGAEFYQEGLIFAKQRVPAATFSQLDILKMDDLAAYDVIGAFDVVEHIYDDKTALKNIARALKSGGYLLLTVPQHQWLWSKVDEYACHQRRYTRNDLLGKIKSVGLEIEYSNSFVALLVPLMWLSRSRAKDKKIDPMDEFRISTLLNRILETVMKIELSLIKYGLNFPVGGSLLVLARKP